MKRGLLFGMAVVVLALSCNKAELKAPEAVQKQVAKVTLDSATKTYLSGNKGDNTWDVLWSAGDKVLINGVESDEIAAEYVGTSYAEFSVAAPVATSYNILYPSSVAKDENTIEIPSTQTYVESNFTAGTVLAVGKSETLNDAQLRNVMGLIQLTISSPTGSLYSVALNAPGAALSGTFKVDYENVALEPIATGTALNVNGLTLNSDNKVVILFAVPAGVYENGFSITMVDAGGNYVTRSTNPNLTITAGHLLMMPELQFNPSETTGKVIMRAANWNDFAAANNASGSDISAWTTDGEVRIGADLDFTGVTLTQVSTLKAGVVLNGQGHKIKNLTTTKGLVKVVKGEVKNIVIDESCIYNPTVSAGTNMAIVAQSVESAGKVRGIVNNASISTSVDLTSHCNLGTIVGLVKSGGEVFDCVNNGNLTYVSPRDGAESAYQCFGGVIGKLEGSAESLATIENCVNNGNVSVTFPKIPGQTIAVGGIVASSNIQRLVTLQPRGVLRGCVNTGNVSLSIEETPVGAPDKDTNNKNKVYALGGITGYLEGDILSCSNKGNITFTSANTYSGSISCPAVGGVAGCVTYNIKDCVNTGQISVSGSFTAGPTDITTSNVETGFGASSNPCFAGVAGKVSAYHTGPYITENEEPCIEATNCLNKGKVLVRTTMNSTNGTYGYTGGVFGYAGCCSSMKGCINEGEVDVVSGQKFMRVAGVTGGLCYKSTIENCHNRGHIVCDLTPLLSEGSGANNGYSAIVVGIVGQLELGAGVNTDYCTIKDCTNSGKLELLGGQDVAEYSRVGGIEGYYAVYNSVMKNCTNTGEIYVNTNAPVTVGGIAACHNGTTDNCTNSGVINIVKASNTQSSKPTCVGGITAYFASGKAFIDNTTSAGDITVSIPNCYVSAFIGNVGQNGRTCKGNTLNCSINAVSGNYVGSVAGKFNGTTLTSNKITWKTGTICTALSSLSLCGVTDSSAAGYGTVTVQ